MSRRGVELQEHILRSAKDVFLEVGFERASMDMISARAATSKRTLYARFESKEKLYLAVIELVRSMFLGRLQSPNDYPGDIEEALIGFCGRFLKGLLYVWTIRMCRMTIAEASRFPEGSARYFDVLFMATQERVRDYLLSKFELSDEEAIGAAVRLLGQVIYPRFPRALFGIDDPGEDIDDDSLDLAPVRRAVSDLVTSLAQIDRLN